MIGISFNRFVNNIIYTENGRIILSIILGLGLASLFRKLCEGKNCYSFIGPKQDEIRNQVFSFDSSNEHCYVMKEKTVACNKSKKIVDFA